MKDSFVLYASHLKQVNNLTDEQAGQLLKAIYLHTQDEEVDGLDQATNILYSIISEQLDKDRIKYEETIEKRSKAGKASAEARSTQSNKTEQKETDVNTCSQVSTDNDNVNDNVYVNDNVKHLYGQYKHVKLTSAQYQDAVAKYGKEQTDYVIDEIDAYCEMHNRTYKNYREAINTFIKRGALDRFVSKNSELFKKSIRRLNNV